MVQHHSPASFAYHISHTDVPIITCQSPSVVPFRSLKTQTTWLVCIDTSTFSTLTQQRLVVRGRPAREKKVRNRSCLSSFLQPICLGWGCRTCPYLCLGKEWDKASDVPAETWWRPSTKPNSEGGTLILRGQESKFNTLLKSACWNPINPITFRIFHSFLGNEENVDEPKETYFWSCPLKQKSVKESDFCTRWRFYCCRVMSRYHKLLRTSLQGRQMNTSSIAVGRVCVCVRADDKW